jgi:hypothetical protein
MSTSGPFVGWAGNRLTGSGVWVIEDASDEQIQFFREAVDSHYDTRPYTMDCDLMKRAGAEFFEQAHKSRAVRSILRSNLDPNGLCFLMFGFDNSKTAYKPVGYVLRYPSQDQIRIFEEADPGFRERALDADPVLMEAAGAERCTDFNFQSEFVAICLGGSLCVSHGLCHYISNAQASD